MNNYMVITEGNESMFIQTDARKDIATKILTRYFLLKYFRVNNSSIKKLFNHYGYSVREFSEIGLSIYNTFKSKNYAIIDLSNIKEYIKSELSSNLM